MKAKDKLDKINARLASYNPEPENRDEMIRNVMDLTSESGRKRVIQQFVNLIFGWTDTLWIRAGLVTISTCLVFVFGFQQFSIINRIGRLENRMVESSTEQIIRQQGEHVLLNSVLMKELGESQFQDSVLVADKDLKNLINSYSELQRRYQDLLRESYSQQLNVNIKKQEL